MRLNPKAFLRHAADLPSDAIDAYANPAAKALVESTTAIGKGMVRKTDKSFWNGYTGLKASPLAGATAWGAAGAYSYWGGQHKLNTAPKLGENAEYMGEAPIHTYDGVSSRTSAPTLGASGSMVFGMHSSRRG